MLVLQLQSWLQSPLPLDLPYLRAVKLRFVDTSHRQLSRSCGRSFRIALRLRVEAARSAAHWFRSRRGQKWRSKMDKFLAAWVSPKALKCAVCGPRLGLEMMAQEQRFAATFAVSLTLGRGFCSKVLSKQNKNRMFRQLFRRVSRKNKTLI